MAAERHRSLSSIPTLGIGVAFRPPFLSELFLRRQQVDFLEITADHYLEASREKQEELNLLCSHFPVIPHGLNLSLGSAEGLDRNYLRKLTDLIGRLQPPWWGEHIAFTRAGGIEIGHLSPLPFTQEAVEVLCRNIKEVRQEIAAPLILENITYMLAVPGGEMNEAEFLAEVVERTECGLLLDITNLYINSVNHAYDSRAFLDRLPLDRVVQLHFVGGHEHGGILIDSHSQATPPQVWALLDEVTARAPVKGIVLERDENLPAFDEVLSELRRAREIGRSHGRWD